jgi:hypothetical protein
MISGRHEADISFDTPTLGFLDYERPYLSNSAEAARGARDLGVAVERAGELRASPGWVQKGSGLRDWAESLRADLLRSVERSWIERDGVRRLPLIAGSPVLARDAAYRATPESYDDNRVWAELLHSGLMDAGTVGDIIRGGALQGDTAFGIFGNRKLTVAFTGHGVAFALLQHDLVREYLLFFFAHAAHLHTRGTWTALECVDLDRSRAEHWPYCLPAQMTIPLLAKWMLVFEDPHTGELWLAKATPRQWLAIGETTEVRAAPTSEGAVALRIESFATSVDAVAVLPRPRGTRTWLRIRLPEDRKVVSVERDGAPWTAYDAAREAIVIPPGESGEIRFTLRTVTTE